MKLKIKDLENKDKGFVELPEEFLEEVRPDIIKRAVLSIQSSKRQPYGSFEEAGKRPSAKLKRRRRDYKTSYGYGISRVPRKILMRRGTRFTWVGAFAPGTVSGRRAHPPKPEKSLVQKINKKERKKAIRSALSANLNKELIAENYRIPEDYPFVLDSKYESLKKTSEVKKAFEKLGFKEELERIKEKKIRAGKGKLRGRKYKKKKGPLIVVSKECSLEKSAKNLNLEVVSVEKLNVELLAPGANYGRPTLFTEAAVKKMVDKKLFM